MRQCFRDLHPGIVASTISSIGEMPALVTLGSFRYQEQQLHVYSRLSKGVILTLGKQYVFRNAEVLKLLVLCTTDARRLYAPSERKQYLRWICLPSRCRIQAALCVSWGVSDRMS